MCRRLLPHSQNHQPRCRRFRYQSYRWICHLTDRWNRWMIQCCGEQDSQTAREVAQCNLEALDVLQKSAVKPAIRSEDRRVGKECVSTCISRWVPCRSTTK